MFHHSQLQAFGSRLLRCDRQVFGSADTSLVEDPITGRHARINSQRACRHREGGHETTVLATPRDKCFFCNDQTPANLVIVDRFGEISVPDEVASFEIADAYLAGKPNEVQTFYGLVSKLAASNKIEYAWWLARTFPNLTPALGRSQSGPPCLVTALNPEFHYTEFHDLPRAAAKAIIQSWQFIESWATSRGITVVPFINGGRRPESGQSVACCHGQIYLFDYVPALYKQIQRRREEFGGCPICDVILQREFMNALAIYEGPGVVVLAHPAPKRSWSLLVAPRSHQVRLQELDAGELADALQRSVRAYKSLNSIEPAHNILLRCGDAVGHAHCEIVPKTETNVLAGLEEATDEITIDVAPSLVKEQLQHRM